MADEKLSPDIAGGKIITRAEAKARGLKRYFTGKPCKHGHVDERLTVNTSCVVCNRAAARINGLRYRQKETAKVAARARQKRHRATDKYRERASRQGRLYRSHPEVAERLKKQWREYWEEYKSRPRAKKRMREYRIQYFANPKNKERINRLARQRVREDVCYKIAGRLRTRLHHALAGKEKVNSAVRLLGCSVDELKVHLEAQFAPGMSWNNWSRTGWHIDHIWPLASFDLTDQTQLAEACNYRNLQPSWAADNIRKGARLL
jgi:hypothetical protein